MSKIRILDKFTDEQFKEIVLKSKSTRHLMKLLGYKTHSKKALQPIIIRCDNLGLTIIKKSYLKYSDDEIIEAAKGEKSVLAIMRKLNLSTHGYAHSRFSKRLNQLGINIKFQPWNKGKPSFNVVNITEYLVKNGKKIQSRLLKKRLIKLSLKKNECEVCGLTEWLGKHLTLQLDHINGDTEDNRIENLRILCPNCHVQTPTHSRTKSMLKRM